MTVLPALAAQARGSRLVTAAEAAVQAPGHWMAASAAMTAVMFMPGGGLGQAMVIPPKAGI